MLEAIFQSKLATAKDIRINTTFLITAWKEMFALYGSSQHEKCESLLYQFVSSSADSKTNLVIKVIFTVGELSLIGYQNDECSDNQKKINRSGRFYIRPSTNLITFIQGLLLPTLPQTLSSKSHYVPDPSI